MGEPDERAEARSGGAHEGGRPHEGAEARERLSPTEARDAARELARRHHEQVAAAAVAREGLRAAERLVADGAWSSLPPGPRYPRWGWRRAVRFATDRGMVAPRYLPLYARYLAARLRHPEIDWQGMVFLGRNVELVAPRGRGRLVLGPWSWIGSGTSLRAHEGNVRLGEKVILGSYNVVNAFLDVEVGADSLFSDGIYVADFDHRYTELHRPIRQQGIVKTPVRVGEDVWVGEKVTILRGADIGSGSVIGSQSVVTGRIPPYSIAVGAPARVVRSRLPKGMTPEEARDLRRRGEPLPGDPLGGGAGEVSPR